MSGFDGSGNYVRPYNWTNDATNSIPITASRFDTDGTTVQGAFNLCLTRDNQGKPSAPLVWTQPLTINSVAVTSATIPANGLYLPAANTVGLASNTTLRWSVNSTGNHVFAAPTSGVGITANGFAGSNIANFLMTGADANILVQSTTSGDALLTLASAGVQTYSIKSIRSTAGLSILQAATSVIDISANRNVTINAPSAGNALQVTGVAGGNALNVTAAAGGNAIIAGDGTLSAYVAAFASSVVSMGSATAHSLQLVSNGLARIVANSTGNVTINAPTSGTTLGLTAVAAGVAMTSTDGTRIFTLAHSGGGIQFGSSSNHSVDILTNNTSRLSFSAAGAATFPGAVTHSSTTTAPTPTATDSSTNVATTAFVNPGSSLGTNGYQKMANGVIFQWGTMAAPGLNATGTVTFPIAFPTNCFSVTVAAQTTTSTNKFSMASAGVPGLTTVVLQNNGGDSVPIMWMAIGN